MVNVSISGGMKGKVKEAKIKKNVRLQKFP